MNKDVEDVLGHFYTIFNTETRYKYMFDSRNAIEFWLKKKFTTKQLKDAATTFRTEIGDKFGKSAKYFYGCKKNGKDFGLFQNFMYEVEAVDERDKLETELMELFVSGDIGEEDQAAVRRGQWASVPWKDGAKAKKIAYKLFQLNNDR